MEILLLISKFFLFALFMVSGLMKLFDPEGTKKAAENFGVPAAVSRIFALALSAVEIAVGVLVWLPGMSWYGAVAALALLAVFSLAIVVQLVQGRDPDCNCFGQLGREGISWKTPLRNLVFMVPALLVIFFSKVETGPNVFLFIEQLSRFEASVLSILISIFVMLTAAVYYVRKISLKQDGLERQIEELQVLGAGGSGEKTHEHMTAPDEGLPIGATVPDFKLPDMNGKAVSFEQLLMRGRAMLFFFISPTCSPCKAMLPEIGKWQEEFAGKIDFVFISSGEFEENVLKLPQLGGQTLLLQKKREVAELFKAKWTPTVILVNSAGIIASRPAPGDALIKELIDDIRQTGSIEIDHVKNGRGMSPNEILIGAEIPEFELPDIKGENVSDELIRGKKTLALFWGLDCPHCQRMLPDVREWEKTANGEVQMVIFSTGDEAENRAMNLSSPILMDEGNKVGNQLGMFGTPSAVLVDKSGKIVSETAVGAEQIWSLIGKRKL